MKRAIRRFVREKLTRLLGIEGLRNDLDAATRQIDALSQQVGSINHQVTTWPNGSLNHALSEVRKELGNIANSNNTLLLFWAKPGDGLVNFGDEMSKEIIEKLFNKKVIYASGDDAQILGVGSIIEYYNGSRSPMYQRGSIYVWGTGVRLQNTTVENRDEFKILALRGKLSAEKMGVTQPIPLGDPGLLANLVYPKSKKTSKIGVVPHMSHMDSNVVKELKNDDRFIIIDPMRDPESVIKDITSCKLVLSSSLHGLVVADSFDIPNAHLKVANLEEGTFKFEDYYSGIGKVYSSYDIEVLSDEQKLQDLITSYEPIKNLEKIQQELIRVFPYSDKLKRTIDGK